MTICTIPDCGKKRNSKKFCASHNHRFKRHGNPLHGGKFRAKRGSGCITDKGYRRLFINGKPIDEHRHIMEKFLGRKLKRYEFVHHIDHDRLNNSIGNLQVMTNIDHTKLHSTKYFRNETHKQCGKCLKIKPRELFHKSRLANSPNRDRHHFRCAECCKIAYLENKNGHLPQTPNGSNTDFK